MKHLLVTNDFPPKIGGIQSLLWEWWRRLPADQFAVLTSPYRGADEFDAEQAFRIERIPEPVLLPHPIMTSRGRRTGRASSVPNSSCSTRPCRSGSSDPSLELPYDVVLHGAEVTVPGRLPGIQAGAGLGAPQRPSRRRRRRVLLRRGRPRRRACPPDHGRAARCRHRALPPARPRANERTRVARFDLPVDAPVIVGVSRLVPRKGFDTAIRAVAADARSASRSSSSRSPASAATTVGSARWPTNSTRPSGSSGESPTTTSR